MDTKDLAASMAAFALLVRGREFVRPDEGWSAEEILAHVVACNRAFTLVAAEVMSGRAASFDSLALQCRPYLRAIVETAESQDGLVDTVVRSGRELARTLAGVTPEHWTTIVPSRIQDGTRVLVDAPLPLHRLLAGHVHLHLATHRGQLAALSAGPARPVPSREGP